jgi:hypothetical protein
LNSVFGQHQGNANNWHVNGLKIRNQVLKSVPENLAKYFPNLRAIEFTQTGLESISNKAVEQFSSLRAFYSISNPVRVLNGDLFQSNGNLNFIAFRNNRIEHIGENFLSNIFGIQLLDFRSNRCINQAVSNIYGINEFIGQLRFLCPPDLTETTTTETEVGTCEETTTVVVTPEPANSCEEDKEDRELKHEELMGMMKSQDEKIDQLIESVGGIHSDLQEIKDPWKINSTDASLEKSLDVGRAQGVGVDDTTEESEETEETTETVDKM